MVEQEQRRRRLDGTQRAAMLLPRLVPGQRRAAMAWNAAAVLAMAASGAALIHILTFHVIAVPSGPRWGQTALSLLARCPLFGPLGLIVASAVLAPLLAFREMLRLERLRVALAALLAARHAPLPATHEAIPRSATRLGGFFLALLALQGVWGAVAALLCPMRVSMVMSGVHMTMTASSPWPLTPLHLLVAALLALALWRFELRLTHLRSQISRRLRALLGLDGHAQALPPIPRVARLAPGWYGHAHFARPPPAATAWLYRHIHLARLRLAFA